MNKDTDMNDVKSAATLREELAAGRRPEGLYGDTIDERREYETKGHN